MLAGIVLTPAGGDGGEFQRVLEAVNQIIFFVAIFGGVIAEICVTIRRFHDLGISGLRFFGFLIPLYNIYLSLILLFKEGDPVDNEYGPVSRS